MEKSEEEYDTFERLFSAVEEEDWEEDVIIQRDMLKVALAGHKGTSSTGATASTK